jgi:hypothetical protein
VCRPELEQTSWDYAAFRARDLPDYMVMTNEFVREELTGELKHE